MTKETMQLTAELVLRLHDLPFKERMTVLVTMTRVSVKSSLNPVRQWGRVLSSLLEGNSAQVELLCANLVAQVSRRHDVKPSLDRTVDVAEGLEAHILAGLERAARVSD
jgi:hypothetical protein